MPFSLVLVVFAAPFAVLGLLIGRVWRLRDRAEQALFLTGGVLILVGIIGMASIGVVLYPLGVLLFSVALGSLAADLAHHRRGS